MSAAPRSRDRRPPTTRPSRGRPPRGRKPAVQGSLERNDGRIRLQRILAAAGLGSRRKCEQHIEEGRVEVDGKVVTELGTRVDPTKSKIRVDGSLLRTKRKRYFAVNKPTGFVTTHRDPAGRPRVVDLVPPGEGLFPVGRLDRASEGLILLTNDGELANQLAHPKYGVEKIYRVLVAGHPSDEALDQLRRGVRLAESWVKAAWLRVKGKQHHATILEMALNEGKNREIRRMAAKIGHKVLSLRRIAFGPLRLGEIPAGAARELTQDEVLALQAAVHRGPRATNKTDEAPRTKATPVTSRPATPRPRQPQKPKTQPQQKPLQPRKIRKPWTPKEMSRGPAKKAVSRGKRVVTARSRPRPARDV